MSLTKVSMYNTEVQTWRVYPRVHYFVRRYNDLLPRFQRVTGTFPKSFQDNTLLSQINKIKNDFGKCLQVNVIGRQNLDLSHVVVSLKPWKQDRCLELSGPAQISVNICYVALEHLDIKGLMSLDEITGYFDINIAKKYPHSYDSLFIVIDTNVQNSEEDEREFRRKVIEKLEILRGDKWEYSDRIIFGSQGSYLSSKISESFERFVVDGFHKVLSYLERFIRKTKQYNTDIDIIHSDLVIKALQTLLRDDIGLADTRKIAECDKSGETDGMSEEEKFLHQFLKKMARLVKCAIVVPLSTKYNILPWICNLLLAEINFEKKIMDSISKNTKYQLSQLDEFSKDYESLRKSYERKANMGKGKHGASQHDYFTRLVFHKFDFIVYPLQNDMSKVVSDAEKTMASAGNVIDVMRKMIFEVEGYLEQTITETYKPKTQSPKIPDDLRSAILNLKDVHAVGTIYDVVEIHVNQETDILKEDLKSLVQKYEFRYPYKVRTVTQWAKVMMADIQHEHGKLIKSPHPDNLDKFREGTLGAFVDAEDGTLYALTCAHVVSNPNRDEHDVYIQDRGLRLRRFGQSFRRLTISTGEGPMPLIDIAAVRVNLDFRRQCIKRLKDDNGVNRSSVVAQETPEQLLKRFVYKHGAMSGLTQGIICSTDFCVSDTDEDKYVLIIESLPGDNNGPFAKRGDSGAVICTSSVDSDSIKVVCMLSAGDYKLAGEDTQEKYISFLMKRGLQKLRDSANISLNVS